MEELSYFENNLLLMIKNIEFRKINNGFQEKLSNDIMQMKNSVKVFISADKSRHVYKRVQCEYEKLLRENITMTYQLKVNNVNSHKRITIKLPISDRIVKLQEKEAYITIND